MFIVRLHLSCWVDCKNGGWSIYYIIHSCGIQNSTVSSNGSGNIVGVKCFGLHNGNRAWGVFL